VRCYGHPIIYKATHKIYNKNFSIESITSEERFEVERTVWYVNYIFVYQFEVERTSTSETLVISGMRFCVNHKKQYTLHSVRIIQ
jgi:hypothetical protein